MTLQHALNEMVSRKASDLYITVDSPCLLRIDGNLHPLGETLDLHAVEKMFTEAMDSEQEAEYRASKEANFAW